MDTPSPVEALLQRLDTIDDGEADLLRTVVSCLSQRDAALPRPPQDVLLPLLQHTMSLLVANNGATTAPISLLLQAATQLLLHHFPPLQPPALPPTITGPIIEVVEATPLDKVPHHLILVAAATAPHAALEPCEPQVWDHVHLIAVVV